VVNLSGHDLHRIAGVDVTVDGVLDDLAQGRSRTEAHDAAAVLS